MIALLDLEFGLCYFLCFLDLVLLEYRLEKEKKVGGSVLFEFLATCFPFN